MREFSSRRGRASIGMSLLVNRAETLVMLEHTSPDVAASPEASADRKLNNSRPVDATDSTRLQRTSRATVAWSGWPGNSVPGSTA